MAEYIKLLSKDPILCGHNNEFMALALLGWRGNKYIVLMHLIDGSIYIEETFAVMAAGDPLVGFEYVKDDKIWNALVYAANGYGVTGQEHITHCVTKLGLSTSNKVVKDILAGIPPQTAQSISKK
jgi:hypothetical protein